MASKIETIPKCNVRIDAIKQVTDKLALMVQGWTAETKDFNPHQRKHIAQAAHELRQVSISLARAKLVLLEQSSLDGS